MEDRPVHCELADPGVRAVASEYRGLSASSLQRFLYFYLSTPMFSAPTFSTAIPTSVQSLTTAYIRQHFAEHELTNPIPDAWFCPDMPEDVVTTIQVDKEHLHLFDGDGGEIFVPEDGPKRLRDLRTRGNYIQFRTMYNDAPEIGTAFRIYRQRGEDVRAVGTVHVGIESLYAAREIVHDPNLLVFIEVNPQFPNLDQHNRRLVKLVLREKTNTRKAENFSAVLARKGYTYSTFQYGIDEKIHAGMLEAIERKRGIFRLPEETRSPGCLPWNIKQAQIADEQLRPIRNVCGDDQPLSTWLNVAATSAMDIDEEELTDSQDADKFSFKVQ